MTDIVWLRRTKHDTSFYNTLIYIWRWRTVYQRRVPVHVRRATCMFQQWVVDESFPVELMQTQDTKRNRRVGKKSLKKQITNSDGRDGKPAPAVSQLFSKPFLKRSRQIAVMVAGESHCSSSHSNTYSAFSRGSSHVRLRFRSGAHRTVWHMSARETIRSAAVTFVHSELTSHRPPSLQQHGVGHWRKVHLTRLGVVSQPKTTTTRHSSVVFFVLRR